MTIDVFLKNVINSFSFRLGSLEDSIPEIERPTFGFVHKLRSPEHKPLPLLEDSISSRKLIDRFSFSKLLSTFYTIQLVILVLALFKKFIYIY